MAAPDAAFARREIGRHKAPEQRVVVHDIPRQVVFMAFLAEADSLHQVPATLDGRPVRWYRDSRDLDVVALVEPLPRDEVHDGHRHHNKR